LTERHVANAMAMTDISSTPAVNALRFFAHLEAACVSLRMFNSAKNRPSAVGSIKKRRDGSTNSNVALSAFFFRGPPMLVPRSIGPIAIEKQLPSPDAPVIWINVSTVDAADVDKLVPGERLQLEAAPARRAPEGRPADIPLEAPSAESDVLLRPFALAFVAMLCATVIGFVSDIRPVRSHSPDYGYDEALGTETSSLSSANSLSNRSDASLAAAEAPKDGLDRLRVTAIAAHTGASLPASFTSKE
jgi:hypothetical protein